MYIYIYTITTDLLVQLRSPDAYASRPIFLSHIIKSPQFIITLCVDSLSSTVLEFAKRFNKMFVVVENNRGVYVLGYSNIFSILRGFSNFPNIILYYLRQFDSRSPWFHF